MSASKIKNRINKCDKKDLSKSNTNMQINMSTLTSAQKQVCLKLLAESNIMFSQEKDFFQAQLRINPLQFTTQLTSENKQTQDISKVSPIKKRQVKDTTNKKIQNKNKQNKLRQKNTSTLNNDKQQQTKAKKAVQNLYASSKKPLSKCVKINSLKNLQYLHPQIQLYIYPKKLSLSLLCQQIQTTYQNYWRLLSKSPHSLTSFPQFTYSQLILHQQKSKTQQSLVNFIQTLNHYAYKCVGIQIFYNFFSALWDHRTLKYFLVIRALLEQLQKQKIVERIVTYNNKQGFTYKLRLNPYDKILQEEKVRYFLDVCCPRTSSHQQDKVQLIFKEMTEIMFFDQKKKKNYIQFHQMADILLRQFSNVQTVNTSDLQLSYTNNNSSLGQFLFQSGQKNLNLTNDHINELQLTFQANEPQNQIKSNNDLNLYLPSQALQNLQLRPTQLIQTFQQNLTSKLFQKYKSIVQSLGCVEVSQQRNSKSLAILEIILNCLIHQDREKWILFVTGKSITNTRQASERFFIDNLIVECSKARKTHFISNQFVRKVLTASFLREAIFDESNRA